MTDRANVKWRFTKEPSCGQTRLTGAVDGSSDVSTFSITKAVAKLHAMSS
ncbi:MAG TPA: hypothetical protein PLG38_08795 [Propionibacteriaceae bacterium]|nr:hypothetical protein [Propionibacteriaceae bacterium]